jgi:hypothetical protein
MVAKDQMRDTMVPGYMFAEAYILETNGFTSNNTDNYNKAKGGMQNVKNAAGNFINWLRDKLATFMPKYFETSLQKQCEWFDKNGKAKYDEIKNAAGKSYNFPSKDKYYKFNVTFDPGKIKAYDIIKSYKDDPNKDLSGLRKELMNAFDNDTNDLAGKLSQMNGENLKKAVENAVLYSSIEEQKPETDHQLTTNDWDDIYNDMVFMCQKDQDGKFRGGKWSNDMKQLSDDLQKAVKELQPEQKPNTESFEIKLGKNMFYVEMDENDGKTGDGATAPTNGSTPPAGDTPTEPPKQGQPQNSEGETGTNDAAKAKRDGDILKQVEDIAAAFLVVSANTIVSKLFPNIYNNFKGVIDDYDATKNGGTDAKSQQTANAEKTQQNAQS